jgi:ribosomal protein S12 methylthiotransferase accessory factor
MPRDPSPAAGPARYRLAFGVDAVHVDDRRVLLRSDLHAARLEGADVGLLVDRVLPLLDGSRTLADLARDLPDLDAGDLRRLLDLLVGAGVAFRDAGADQAMVATPPAGGLEAYLESAGIRPADARRRLAAARVAIVGLAGPGAHAAAMLAACGIGQLVLADPDPVQPWDDTLPPPPGGPGQPRERALARALAAAGGASKVEASGWEAVSRDGIAALAGGCDLLVGCSSPRGTRAHHWLNRACLDRGIPAVHVHSGGDVALIGPLVVPGETACYLCWRLRALACSDDVAEAMAAEESAGRRLLHPAHATTTLPGLAPYAGAIVALAVVRRLLALGEVAIAGAVHEFDGSRPLARLHRVLLVPRCPACAREPRARSSPPLAELARPAPAGDPPDLEAWLVSEHCGVVTGVGEVAAGPGEPAALHSWYANLANHRLLDRAVFALEGQTGWGKGLTAEEARRGALGEAVERYCAGTWDPNEIVHARRSALDGPSLDPRSLVLYAPEQYTALEYAPYHDGSSLGWMPARSLVSGARVLVPAIAVLFGYRPASAEEHLCPSGANGLASGASLGEAVLAAACEVLERDAFLVTWMNRLPAERVEAADHPDPEVAGLWHNYRRRGVELRLYRLASDHPCQVFLARALQRDGHGPASTVGLGADLDPARAARRALLEAAQVRAGLRRQLDDPRVRARIERLAADPRAVVTPEDHALRYCDARTADAFAFLEAGPTVTVAWDAAVPPRPASRIALLAGHFRARGGELLYVDLTTADMAKLGLHAARVLVPGFQPLHFGAAEPRLGGRRLFELPYRLGRASSPATPATLNPDPHPLG